MTTEPRKVQDPGPPTWIEAAEGFALMTREAGDKLRDKLDILRQAPEPYSDDIAPSPEWLAARSNFSAADAEWRHWHRYQRCYEAFIRLHPNMANVKIDAECEHKGACRVSDDDGFYRDPNPQAPPAQTYRSRVPGEDDDEDAA